MARVEKRGTTTADIASSADGWRALRDAGSLLAVAAISLYAVAYFTQYSFYEPFGVTPDEVGIDKVSALLRLLPLMFTVGLAILVVTVAFMGLGIWIRDSYVATFDKYPRLAEWFPDLRRDFPPMTFLVLVVVGALLLLDLLIIPNMGLGPDTDDLRNLSKLVWVILCMGGIVTVPWLIVRRFWNSRVAATIATFVAVCVTGLGLYAWVGAGAQTLYSTGIPAQRLYFVGINIHDVTARWYEPAHKPSGISEPASVDPKAPPHLLIQLNHSTTAYTLYDCATRRTFIVSNGDVDVEDAHPPRGLPDQAATQWFRDGLACGTHNK
jgi:hypothetical protein